MTKKPHSICCNINCGHAIRIAHDKKNKANVVSLVDAPCLNCPQQELGYFLNTDNADCYEYVIFSEQSLVKNNISKEGYRELITTSRATRNNSLRRNKFFGIQRAY